MRTQIIQPPADTRVLLGLTASLQCKVSSDPSVPFNIDWYRESQATPITNSQRIGVQADGTLEIQAVRASDVGTYSCMVTSPGGNETRSARLSVIELPFAPTNVKAERIDTHMHRSINISWTAGFDGNSPILKFIIQRREVPELGKLNALYSSSIFIFRLLAHWLSHSVNIYIQLHAFRTQTQFLFVFIIFILHHLNRTKKNQTYLFRMTKLKEEFIGPIPDPLLNWITELSNVSANQRWILLRTLKAASVYQFRVSAVNSVGEGSPSDPSNVIRLPQEGKDFSSD